MFTAGFDLVVACNIRRATTSPCMIVISTRARVGQSTYEFHKAGHHDKPVAHSSGDSDRSEVNDVPYYDPCYAFHRVIVQVIMDGIQLRVHVSAQM